MDFNLQVPDEEEVKESVSEDEVFPDAPSSVPFLGEAEAPTEAGSFLSPVRVLPSDLYGSEARTTEATRSSP